MAFWDKITDVWGNIKSIGTGAGRVMAGDWTGFTSVYDGVRGLFKEKDAAGKWGYKDAFSNMQVSPFKKPNVSLMGYTGGTSAPSSAGRISALGDTDRIPDWSRNQAVAMYYLNMINKITTQGSDRKGA